ncbi:hypothetical protein EG68_12212 [Paragonimus skrjabini miyazakii]|uniref:Transposase n=1 Tax=Paragonimus skrjabini miyazakii TaxID=59628 RepID=A0A8S9YJC1_9TREM|nr:hypothetical protein EG68_12212 [Paragonimus skrjabini miyazakii]
MSRNELYRRKRKKLMAVRCPCGTGNIQDHRRGCTTATAVSPTPRDIVEIRPVCSLASPASELTFGGGHPEDLVCLQAADVDADVGEMQPSASSSISEELRYTQKPVVGGGYIHLGLETALWTLLRRELAGMGELQLLIEGLSPSKRSAMHLWPVLGRCLSFTAKPPFVVGIYCRTRKPRNVNAFLRDTIDELMELPPNGIVIDGDKRIDVRLSCIICDTPVRALVKQTVSHTGYKCYDKCVQARSLIGRKLVFSSPAAASRYDRDLWDRIFANHLIVCSPFLDIDCDMVHDFPLDYMQTVCVGVVKDSQ